MTLLVTVFGVLIAALGSVGVISPSTLLTLVDRPWQSRRGLVFASLFRLLLGALLIAVADDTRSPRAITGLGVLSLAGAVLAPVLGFERLRRFVDWWLARPPLFIRSWGLIAVGFGAFLIYAAN